jgi:hypothetical protein
MAPQFFGTSPAFFNKLLDVGSRESGDPKRGVKPGTLASMLNRYHNPQFGSSGNWLNPGQYAVLGKGGFNPNNPAVEKARNYYSSPEGKQELFNYAQQLGGVTDFRSTKYLQETGNLLKYGTNLIPAIVQGQRRFVTPQKLKELGATPDLSENTFFNETKRPPTKQWWNSAAPPAPTLPPASTTVTSAPREQGNKLGASLLNLMLKNTGLGTLMRPQSSVPGQLDVSVLNQESLSPLFGNPDQVPPEEFLRFFIDREVAG